MCTFACCSGVVPSSWAAKGEEFAIDVQAVVMPCNFSPFSPGNSTTFDPSATVMFKGAVLPEKLATKRRSFSACASGTEKAIAAT